MRRFGTLVVVVGLVASACGGGGGAARAQRLVEDALEGTDLRSRSFTYVEVSNGQEVVVRGEERDDLRYRGVVSIEGKDVFEGIVSDDGFALRLPDPAAAPGVVEYVSGVDEVLGRALEEGRWAVDFTAAPPLVPERGEEGEFGGGRNPFLDVFYLFRYLDQAVTAGVGVQLFNPERIQYNPHDDPWSEDDPEELQAQGIRRYDLILPPLPPPQARGQQQQLPGPQDFRKMVFYLKGRQLVEVKEQIDIEDRREFRRAEQGRAADYYLELKQLALNGFTEEPVRERRMRYAVSEVGRDHSVEVPTEDTEAGSLGDIFGPRGLGSLFAGAEREETPDDVVPGLDSPDLQAQSALRNAVTAAKTIYADSSDYTQATPEALGEAEPSLEFVAGESTGPGVVSVGAPDADTFLAAALSPSGRCFGIREVAGEDVVFAQKGEGPCTAGGFPSDGYSEGGWQ